MDVITSIKKFGPARWYSVASICTVTSTNHFQLCYNIFSFLVQYCQGSLAKISILKYVFTYVIIMSSYRKCIVWLKACTFYLCVCACVICRFNMYAAVFHCETLTHFIRLLFIFRNYRTDLKTGVKQRLRFQTRALNNGSRSSWKVLCGSINFFSQPSEPLDS